MNNFTDNDRRNFGIIASKVRRILAKNNLLYKENIDLPDNKGKLIKFHFYIPNHHIAIKIGTSKMTGKDIFALKKKFEPTFHVGYIMHENNPENIISKLLCEQYNPNQKSTKEFKSELH